ncbi:hypothetical protein EMIT0P228_150027 [Pseudomonas brassicacearum]
MWERVLWEQSLLAMNDGAVLAVKPCRPHREQALLPQGSV